MEPTEYPAMSGSNTICTTTVLLETGMLELREPETVVRLEAPGGVVEARAACRDGRCESVEFTNVACFADRLDASLEVEGFGTIVVDVAYGGMWYAIADAAALGFAIEPHEARDLSLAGERIRAAAREQLPCAHPENPEIAGVSIVQLAEPWQGVGKVTRNAVVVAPGRLDRSATGTGLSARLAVLHARGLMQVGDAMTHASAIGSTFDGRIVAETRWAAAGDRPGDPRQRLDHRRLPALRRSGRPVPGGLRPLGHLGRQRARHAALAAVPDRVDQGRVRDHGVDARAAVDDVASPASALERIAPGASEEEVTATAPADRVVPVAAMTVLSPPPARIVSLPSRRR